MRIERGAKALVKYLESIQRIFAVGIDIQALIRIIGFMLPS